MIHHTHIRITYDYHFKTTMHLIIVIVIIVFIDYTYGIKNTSIHTTISQIYIIKKAHIIETYNTLQCVCIFT